MATRQAWPDAAKGACILLVVFWHDTVLDYVRLGWRLSLPLAGLWGTAGEALRPLRMPLFFALSGMFAARAVMRPWPSVVRARVARFAYLYVLWLLLHTAFFRLTPGFGAAVVRSPAQLLEQLTISPGNLWYLQALLVYFVVARSTRRVPGTVLAASLMLSVAVSSHWFSAPGNRASLLQNLCWFLIGLHATAWADRFARRTTARTAAMFAACYVVLASFTTVAGIGSWPGVRLVTGAVGVCAGISAAALLCRGRSGSATGRRPGRTGRALARLGRRTLPVYVIHMPLVALLHDAVAALFRRAPGLGHSLLLAAGYPVLATAAIVSTCLVIHQVLRRAGLRWLFELPGRVAGSGRHRTTTPI